MNYISRWFAAVPVLILMGYLAVGSVHAGTAQGHAYLEGESNHSGIRVELYRHPWGEPCPNTSTNASGYYSKTIIGGYYYYVVFSKPCFLTQRIDSVWIPLIGTVTLPPVTLKPVLCQHLDWCDSYPYEPPGTSIEFPEDEGKHNPYLDFPIEWWYANFHLTGTSTETEFGAFVAFFKIPPPNSTGMRLFSISDLDLEQTYTHSSIGGALQAETTNLDLEYWDGDLSHDLWWNKTYCDNGDWAPFQYRMKVTNTADEDGLPIALDIFMQPWKAPMIVGGDGIVWIGEGWSYYYSHTKVVVDGVITVHGVTDSVTGYAWIDHQWGAFLLGEAVTWEWLSIQLDDLREIMVADVWVDREIQGSYCDGLNLYNEDCSLDLLDDYTIIPLASWRDPVCDRTFVTQWKVEEASRNIDLLVTADYENQMMQVTQGIIFPKGCFWEGSCSVTGTIDGMPVSGKAYAESTNPRDTVYGVWYSSKSPYYVCCDVTVPQGKELLIEPGVEVLFTGHHKFNVRGTLKAMGTEEDSIVFTHYWNDEDSTWGGIRFYDAEPPCTLQYCVIEYGEATGSGTDIHGGGVYCKDSDPVIAHCTIRLNSAEGLGDAVYCMDSNVKLDTCLIVENPDSCVAPDDQREAIFYGGTSSVLVTNCTISANAGYGAWCYAHELPEWHMTARNTIIWGNCVGSVESPCNSFSATYSDIEYDPCGGEGVIDCDPEFEDYYRLSEGSCCIDSGDPDSPNDPDDTRADIGAFYFHQPCRSLLVKPDGTGDYSTIQEAIDAARPNCDTVLLTDGTFWGTGNRDITFRGNPIVVRSQHGAEACTVDCVRTSLDAISPHRGFRFDSGEGPNSVLEGVTILNGGMWGPGDTRGGAILCDGSSPTIIDCRVISNWTADSGLGGGICCDSGSSPTIGGCVITGNRAFGEGGDGGGIYWSRSSYPEIISCTISGNKAHRGGGLFGQGGASRPENTIVWGNCAESGVGDEWYGDNECHVECCLDLDSTGLDGFQSCVYQCGFHVPNIYAYPWFCDPAPCDDAPTTAGDYRLFLFSPCAPWFQPDCGLIGALGVSWCFILGDVNANGSVDVGDIVYLVNYLYKGGAFPNPPESGDVNCDGITNVGDVVYLVSYLYKGGPAPDCP